MATMDEALQFVKRNFESKELTDTLLRLTFSIDAERSQVVFFEVNNDFAVFSSPFAEAEDVTPKQALTAAGEYLAGIQLVGDFYYVKHMAPLANLDESEIEDGFDLVANIADRLEQELVGSDVV